MAVRIVFKWTIDLVLARARKWVADKLQDGDVTDELFRNFVVCEIDKIKSKLDGLARTNVLASICFFKEGLVYLYKVLDSKTIEQDGKVTQQGEEGKEKNSAARLQPSQVASVKTVSLANKMRGLRVSEQDELTRRALSDAKDRFKQARQKATEAFCNEALSTSDRILAMEYRVMATLLEKIDNPAEALAACILCLEELHSMPAVQNSFHVHVNKGLKSWFNKAEREEIICSVCRVNKVIFHVMQTVGRNVNLSLWPCVDIGKEKVDPLRDMRVTESQPDEETEHCFVKPWALVQDGAKHNLRWPNCYITTNTHGQFIIASIINEVPSLKEFDRNGSHLHTYRLIRPAKATSIAIDTDQNDNVFLLVNWISEQEDFTFRVWSTVYKFDEHANQQDEFDLEEGSVGLMITVNDKNKVFVAVRRSDVQEVQVYDTNGNHLNSFGEGAFKGAIIKNMTATNSVNSRILILEGKSHWEHCDYYVRMYSQQGKYLSEFKCGDSKPSCLSSVASHRTSEHFFLLLQESHHSKCIYPRMLHIFTKDGEFVRSIHLHAEWLMNQYKSVQGAIVTKEGLVAIPALDKRTGKMMIVVL